MPKENKSSRQDQHAVCSYRLLQDSGSITMITDCKECGGKADLTDSACRSGVLNGLYNEYNVGSVVLSHYIETKYTDDSMQLLTLMVEILQDFEQLSIREPYLEYFQGDDNLSSQTKNQQKMECEKCPLKPEKIFAGLKREFLSDLENFFQTYKALSKEVGVKSYDNCILCMNTTQSDFMYLFSKLEKLRSFIIYKGFQIIV